MRTQAEATERIVAAIMARRTAASGLAVFVDGVILRQIITPELEALLIAAVPHPQIDEEDGAENDAAAWYSQAQQRSAEGLAWRQRAEAAEAQIAQLQQENDQLSQRNTTQALTIHNKREAWFHEKTRADAAEAALREYGQHRPECRIAVDHYGRYINSIGLGDCDCGLDRALGSPPPPRDEK